MGAAWGGCLGDLGRSWGGLGAAMGRSRWSMGSPWGPHGILTSPAQQLRDLKFANLNTLEDEYDINEQHIATLHTVLKQLDQQASPAAAEEGGAAAP